MEVSKLLVHVEPFGGRRMHSLSQRVSIAEYMCSVACVNDEYQVLPAISKMPRSVSSKSCKHSFNASINSFFD